MKIRLIVASFIVLGAGCAQQPVNTVSSFEECVAAGNPVMESYPRQCRSKNGELFVEQICLNQCGNGVCEEIVCLAAGCPCAETAISCPQDCTE